MSSHGLRFFGVAVGLAAASISACKKEAPAPPQEQAAAPAPAPAAEFSVSGIELGKQIGSDKKVTAPTTSFSPKDTIYASVTTEGAAPSKTLVAKWTFGGTKTIKTDSQTIAPTGPASTEFHISKPSGWPVGRYAVDVSVDGNSAGNKEFEVKK